jgi:2'-5' RNA ligase
MKRLFAALELPETARATLETLIRSMRPEVPRGLVRWVRPEGVHLTLQFYGDVPAGRQLRLEAVLRDAAVGRRPLRLSARGVSAFPRPTAARVLWAGLEGDLDATRDLQRQIVALAEVLGFRPEARGFTPHLTLGRVREDAGRERLALIAGALARHATWTGPSFEVGALSLMQSDRRPDGAIYSALAQFPFSPEAESPG